MKRGFAYLMAIMDWSSRSVLSWEVSNTLDTSFCLNALEGAIQKTGTTPEIFNTDQGCQFTSADWIEAVQSRDIQVSMDGKGCWIDNVFIERLWRTVKYEDVYLRGYEDLESLREGLARWFDHYNHERPHAALKDSTPWEVYRPESLAQAA
jgi:putative transposase